VTRVWIIVGWIIVGSIIVLGSVSLASVVLAAAPVTVIIPLETIVRGDPGEILPVRDPISVSELDAEPGWFCNVTVIAGNGDSEHDGTNLIIGSNGDQVIALDVEATAGGVTEAVGTLTLGEIVTFDGQLGEDGVLSAGMNVVFECFEERPPLSTTTTTTTEPPGSTTTTTTTEPPPSTTTTMVVTTTIPNSTTTTSAPPSTTTTQPPNPTTTTTEVPPPTLIESGDAGYIEAISEDVVEAEHEDDEGFDWLFFGMAAIVAMFAGSLAYLVVKRVRES